MNRLCYIIGVSLLFVSSSVFSQTYVDWEDEKTVDNVSFNAGGTTIIRLKGDDIYLRGTITVRNSTTVRIVNYAGTEVRIHNGTSGDRSSMFVVDNTSKLTFNKESDNDTRSYNPIVIDGGAAFKWDKTSNTEKWILSSTTSNRFIAPMFNSIGALQLRYVTIRNFYSKDKEQYDGVSVISINPNNTTCLATTLEHCTIERCKARIGTAIYAGNGMANSDAASCGITLTDCTIRQCVQFCDNSGWGGVIRFRGGTKSNLTLVRTTITENFSHGDGAGLWWNACGSTRPVCVLNGCTITNNRAKREAGGLRLEGQFRFEEAVTTVSGNRCEGLDHRSVNGNDVYTKSSVSNGNGGGIHIYGYVGNWAQSNTFNYELNQYLVVRENYAAGYGGGIAFDFGKTVLNNTSFIAHFDGLSVKNNQAGLGGGGVYFYDSADSTKGNTFEIWLNSGSIAENSAPNGGGIYVENIDINYRTSANVVSVERNIATNGSGGGIYLKNGDISLNDVNVKSNKSEGHVDGVEYYGGGGIYVENGSFTIKKGEISGNSSSHFGGGVLVQSYSTGNVYQSVNLTGGTIKQNTAHYGGGLAALGNLKLTINSINVENNTATNGNGGGVFVQGKEGHATLNYASGLVRKNRATCTGTKPTTAYGNNNTDASVTYKNVSGMGGGICMGKNTTFEYVVNQTTGKIPFGVYDNLADSGADDFFATENGTTIILPSPSIMDLTGDDDSKDHNLFWFEDYITCDPNYCYGTARNSEWTLNNSQNQRYRDVRDNKVVGESYNVEFDEEKIVLRDKYLCFTLGWYVGKIVLIKEGMKDGENAIFKVYHGDNEYMTVILTDADKRSSDGKRVKQITLNEDGTWKIVETPWSWAYTPNLKSIEKSLNASSTSEERTFRFTNTVSSTVSRDESVKINEMKFSN